MSRVKLIYMGGCKIRAPLVSRFLAALCSHNSQNNAAAPVITAGQRAPAAPDANVDVGVEWARRGGNRHAASAAAAGAARGVAWPTVAHRGQAPRTSCGGDPSPARGVAHGPGATIPSPGTNAHGSRIGPAICAASCVHSAAAPRAVPTAANATAAATGTAAILPATATAAASIRPPTPTTPSAPAPAPNTQPGKFQRLLPPHPKHEQPKD